MKRMIIALVAMFMMTFTTASAMSYEQARQQALFLTDKMAYELNLTEDQICGYLFHRPASSRPPSRSTSRRRRCGFHFAAGEVLHGARVAEGQLLAVHAQRTKRRE